MGVVEVTRATDAVLANLGPVIDMPIDLLGAIATFAYQGDDMREHLRGVYVSAEHLELIACDGSRLARIELAAPVFHGDTDWNHECSSFLIPLDGICAVLTAATRSSSRYVKIRYDRANKLVRFDVCDPNHKCLFTIWSPTPDLMYPPVDQIMPAATPGDGPPEILFDPRLLADIVPIVTGLHAPRYGLTIKAWGDRFSPMLFTCAHARFVVMPMRHAQPELNPV